MKRVKPGDILLVESLDRLSRDAVTEQLALFLRIINAGIELVTLADERVYTKVNINQDPTQLIISIVYMIRGWEESDRKAARVKHAWKSKRDDAGMALTEKCPAWLKPSNEPGKRFAIIEERAKVIRWIFKLAGEGFGAGSIVRMINNEKIKPWGSGEWWNRNYVRRILRGRAVLGEFQPQIRLNKSHREPAGPPRLNYYPPIVDVDVWHRANQSMQPCRGGGEPDSAANLLVKIVFNGPSGAPMRFRAHRNDGRPTLSSSAVERGDSPDTWNYDIVEQAILTHLDQLDWNAILEEPEDGEIVQARRRIEAEIGDVQLKLRRAMEFVTKHNISSHTLANEISKLEHQERDLQSDLASIRDKGGEFEEVTRQMTDARNEFLRLARSGDLRARRLLRNELRVLITRIDLWGSTSECDEVRPYIHLVEQAVRNARMELKNPASGWPCFRITFRNGQQRWILCERRRLRRRSEKTDEIEEVRSLAIVLPMQPTGGEARCFERA
jgi:DNA invertase Pin-like site-specific DNA recombinase